MVSLEPRKYSERLGAIDGDQLHRACDQFDLGTLQRAEPASAGLWGQNILLSATTGEFVLRGNPQTPQQFSKEHVVAAEINSRSPLPVPWPYHVSNDIDCSAGPSRSGRCYRERWDRASGTEPATRPGSSSRSRMATRWPSCTRRVSMHPVPTTRSRTRCVATDDFLGWTLAHVELLPHAVPGDRRAVVGRQALHRRAGRDMLGRAEPSPSCPSSCTTTSPSPTPTTTCSTAGTAPRECSTSVRPTSVTARRISSVPVPAQEGPARCVRRRLRQ